MKTLLLLTASNVFMTIAWYGHLKHKSFPLVGAILISWLIAFPEYCLQVPANRLGHSTFSAPQLKIIQEAISIVVFLAFCALYLKEPIRMNHLLAFALIFAGVGVALWPQTQSSKAFAPTPVADAEPAS